MQFQNFLSQYWHLFNSHLCEFHPLDLSFIERYKEELNWKAVSKNKQLNWGIELIQSYKDKWQWNELAMNPSIIWTEEWIDNFKTHLKWNNLSYNVNLPISEDFIQKYLPDIYIVENNTNLTTALREKYAEKILPAKEQNMQVLQDINEYNIEEQIRSYEFYYNQEKLYTDYLLPNINKLDLETIFEQYRYSSQRYFFLSPIQQDEQGLRPAFVSQPHDSFEACLKADGFLDVEKPLNLKQDPLMEGSNQLFEVMKLSNQPSSSAMLLISKNVKQILSIYDLPKHIFHPVNISFQQTAKSTPFYIFQIEYDSLTELASTEGEIPPYYLKSAFAVYALEGRIIVNEFVKYTLETLFPNQMAFESAQALKIRVDESIYKDRMKYYASLMIQAPSAKTDEKLIYQRYSLYPIYEKIKDYYLFYFPEYSNNLYYSATETKRLYELILNKDTHPLFKTWENLLRSIKIDYPNFKVYHLESNKPSYTACIQLPQVESQQANIYFSVSLIGPFYMLLIEEKKLDTIVLYVSPEGIYTEIFSTLENAIEDAFNDYIFICYNLLNANFFNLVIPGRNQSKREDGYVDQHLPILHGLFFDYDLTQEGFLSRRGDKSYKTSDRFTRYIDTEEVEKIKRFLKNTKTNWKEIE